MPPLFISTCWAAWPKPPLCSPIRAATRTGARQSWRWSPTARCQLAIEALVSPTASPAQMSGRLPEHQRICQLCHEPRRSPRFPRRSPIPPEVAATLVAGLAESGSPAVRGAHRNRSERLFPIALGGYPRGYTVGA
ncbi:DUF742 domain-containing protein [Streptomyces litchfieldiae]|uniref:DUF742 domain-containing protein n=1 Tax=Streptomyces litchfieldiae TaxID=3075543 RepID=UPI00374E0555